ncbi:MAG TPA: penicillin-binding protein [Bacilli bacterium]|nr:penicillin-binding protein [Bacilli bacterium]
MNREILNKNRKFIANSCCLVFFCLLIIILVRLIYLSLSPEVNGVNLKTFSNNRNTKQETLYALRGTIYDTNGEILAQTINSYTVIAYLDSSRSTDDIIRHVKDKEYTAQKLSEVLGMTKEYILSLLNRKAYQVELGPGGKGITELKKDEIKALALPGIDFITTYKRYYPNDDFASYSVGYTKTSDTGLSMTGELGIEASYNKYLNGTNGYHKYVKDINGYKIPNTPEIIKNKKDGYDVYLTLDSNIQMSVEAALDKAYTDAGAIWAIMTVADAKTGKILATSSKPSFNPNIMNIKSWINPLVSFTYEPGSVMKIYTFMAALENSNINLNSTYQSGAYKVGKYTIGDWNGRGWGTISYEKAFTLSSNTGIANIIKNYITKEQLKSQFLSLGFGSKTGIELPNESNGIINFKYDVEIVNSGFGQGITTTAIQQIQALTAIANDGRVVKPTIIDKIVDPNTKKVIYKSKIEYGNKVASKKTTDTLKELMYKVVNNTALNATGYAYKIDGYDLIGKTGTAQIVDSRTNNYYIGGEQTIISFASMYPKDDPEVIIYIAMRKKGKGNTMPTAVKTIVRDTAKYLNIFEGLKTVETGIVTYDVGNYINKDIDVIKNQLTESKAKYIVFGDGSKIIKQYPNVGTKYNNKEKIFLITNDTKKKMPNLYGYSYRETKILLDLLGIKYNITGNGYVKSQSILTDTIIDNKVPVEILCETL